MQPSIGATHYGPAMRSFHWLTVALLALQYAVGWTMPEVHRDTRPETLINLHLSFGMLIGALMLIRAAWRVTTSQPAPDPAQPMWQRKAAAAVHGLLYLLVFALVLTGWANASVRGWNVTLFGGVPLPALVAQGSSLGHAFGELHEGLVTVTLIVIGAHVLAALAHLLLLRDQMMQRMLPPRRAP